ncbi:MAG: hypothetical protein WBP93_13670 [Pyrinomonadaceae bacterium]
MDWTNAIGGLLQQYSGANANQTPDTVHDDFDQFTQAAPSSTIADGLAEAFRSDQTPPFAQMVGQLFNNGNSQQRAGILNTLISAAGPTIISQVLSRTGGSGGGLSGLAGLLGGGQTTITPEQAEEISPEAVQQIAAHAEQHDPSVIDRVSDFYAEHPTLVKTLGAAALGIALTRIANRL